MSDQYNPEYGSRCRHGSLARSCEPCELTWENARLREQAEALAEVVNIARNGHYWASADSLGYLQSRVRDLADKANAAFRSYREASNG